MTSPTEQQLRDLQDLGKILEDPQMFTDACEALDEMVGEPSPYPAEVKYQKECIARCIKRIKEMGL